MTPTFPEFGIVTVIPGARRIQCRGSGMPGGWQTVTGQWRTVRACSFCGRRLVVYGGKLPTHKVPTDAERRRWR